MPDRTIAVRPAAGPLTISCDPLSVPTTMPPTMPEMMPAKRGAPDARAMPRQSGTATRKTTMAAGTSARQTPRLGASTASTRDSTVLEGWVSR